MSFSSDPATLVNQLPISIDFPKEQDKFLEVLSNTYKRIANSVNNKEGGLYNLQELYNSQLFFTPENTQSFRNVYRFTYDLVMLNGAPIAPSATVTFPHGISGIKSSTHIYASCTSDVPEFFTVVYPDVKLNETDIVFTNPTTDTLTFVYLIAEYLKN